MVHGYLERKYISAAVHDEAVSAIENYSRLLSNDFQCSTNAQFRQHFQKLQAILDRSQRDISLLQMLPKTTSDKVPKALYFQLAATAVAV